MECGGRGDKSRDVFFFQAEDGIRGRSVSRGLGDVYEGQIELSLTHDIQTVVVS
ncbi:hypothetical protein SGP15020_41520 [Shigella flexneri]|nr:hypothetical protein SGP15020_41520 [Shigella flexneri]